MFDFVLSALRDPPTPPLPEPPAYRMTASFQTASLDAKVRGDGTLELKMGRTDINASSIFLSAVQTEAFARWLSAQMEFRA